MTVPQLVALVSPETAYSPPSAVRRPRVLQVVDTLGMGGAETWLIEVLRLWAKNGAGAMDFLLTSGKAGVFDEEARQLGASLYYVPFSRRGFPRFTRELRRILQGQRYCAIHDHSDYASSWHFLAGTGCLPPVRITHVHNPAYQIVNNREVNLARIIAGTAGRSLVACFTTHIAGTSRQVIGEYGFDRAIYRRIPKAALHCGFDPARFRVDRAAARASICAEFGWPLDARIILFAGRLDISPDPGHPQNHKNSGFALSVAMEAARRDHSITAIFAGAQTSALPILQQRVQAAGLQDRIHFAGVRKDIERLMAAAGLLLFPSRGEGLGMVAVESQASGLPVLASTAVPRECVVVPELVRFEDLRAPVAHWATILLQHYSEHVDAAEANARVAVSRFCIDYSARALLSLYTSGQFL